jgi:hypothetical protein
MSPIWLLPEPAPGLTGGQAQRHADLEGDVGERLRVEIDRMRLAGGRLPAERPTSWAIEIHASSDFLERMSHERPGTVAILCGRNRGKIGHVTAALEAGLNVLADKPLIIRREDLPALETALSVADQRDTATPMSFCAARASVRCRWWFSFKWTS